MSDLDKDMIMEEVVPIGALAAAVGVSVSAVRKYESEGLLVTHRSVSGRRMFSLEDVRRVRVIRHLIRDLGLNVEGIRRLCALSPCWRLRPCTGGSREHCPAFAEETKPCWAVKSPQCPPQGNECRKCPAYRLWSHGVPSLKRLLHGDGNPNSPAAPAGEVL